MKLTEVLGVTVAEIAASKQSDGVCKKNHLFENRMKGARKPPPK
jgi:hypothetical protein